MRKKSKLDIFVIGPYKDYASWMNGNLVNDIALADLVWLTGGEDINPEIYKQPCGSRTHFSEKRDDMELQLMKEAVDYGIPMFGTCRGAQLLCAYAGGSLVQHMSHPYNHLITLWDGTVLETNSLHHQLQFPFSMARDKYEILGWANGISHTHLNGNDERMLLPTGKNNVSVIEPELVYYRELKALGIQGHPEMINKNSKLVKILTALVLQLIEGNMDNIIHVGMGVNKLLSLSEKDINIIVLEEEEPSVY